jgi:hypothetical protein
MAREKVLCSLNTKRNSASEIGEKRKEIDYQHFFCLVIKPEYATNNNLVFERLFLMCKRLAALFFM